MTNMVQTYSLHGHIWTLAKDHCASDSYREARPCCSWDTVASEACKRSSWKLVASHTSLHSAVLPARPTWLGVTPCGQLHICCGAMHGFWCVAHCECQLAIAQGLAGAAVFTAALQPHTIHFIKLLLNQYARLYCTALSSSPEMQGWPSTWMLMAASWVTCPMLHASSPCRLHHSASDLAALYLGNMVHQPLDH